MNESILDSIKNLLDIDKELTAFDQDIIFDINSTLFTLYQIGVGDKPYHITSSLETWQDFLKEYDEIISLIKSYVYMKVKQVFDPSTTSFISESFNNQISELEWRIQVQIETFQKLEHKSKRCEKHKKPEKCEIINDKELIPDIVIEELWNEEG